MRDRRYGTMIDKLGEGTRAYDDFTKQMGSQPDFGVPPEEPPVEEPSLWEKIFSPFSPKVQAWRQRQMPVTSDMTTAPQTVGQPPDLRQSQGVPILPPRPREITMSPASPEALRSESGRSISPYGGGAAWSELTPEQQLEVIAKTPKTDPIESAMQNNPILATLRQGSEIASSIVGPGMTGPAFALAGMGGKVVKGAKVIKGAEEAAKGAKAIPKAGTPITLKAKTSGYNYVKAEGKWYKEQLIEAQDKTLSAQYVPETNASKIKYLEKKAYPVEGETAPIPKAEAGIKPTTPIPEAKVTSEAFYWGGKELDKTKGAFLSTDPEYAAKFASQTGGTVHEVTLTSEPKIYPKVLGWEEYQQIWRKDQMFEGYDAVRVLEPNGQGESLVIRNPKIMSETSKPTTTPAPKLAGQGVEAPLVKEATTVPPVKPPVSGDKPPIEPPKPPEPVHALNPPTPPEHNILGNLQDTDELVTVMTKPDVYRKIANLPGVKQVASYLNPAGVASTAPQKAIVARAALREEGANKAIGAFSRLEAIGTRDAIWGKLDDAQRITQGKLAGKPLDEVLTYRAKYANDLTPQQKQWAQEFHDLEQAKLNLLTDNGIEVNTLTFEEGGEYVGRRVAGRINPQTGEIAESAFVGAPGPGRPGARMGAEKTRYFKDINEAIDQGYRYLPPDEALFLNLKGAYNRIADKQVAEWVLDRIAYRTTGAPENLVKDALNARTKLWRSRQLEGALNRAVRGERIPGSTISSIAETYPEQANKLKELIPSLQEGKPVADKVQALTAEAKSLNQQNQIAAHRAIDARARAREAAMSAHLEEASVQAPAFAGKILTGPEAKETANILNKAFSAQYGDLDSLVMSVNKANAIGRYFALAGDASPLMIQLITFPMRFPKQYGKSAVNFVKALFNEKSQAAYLAKNNDIIQKSRNLILTKGGQTEFTEAFRSGGIMQSKYAKAPKAVLEPFQRGFEAALDTAGIELRKSFDHLATTPQRTAEVEQFINEIRGITSSARIGVSPSIRAAETAAFLAPRYNRAIVALVSDIARGGIRGDQARKALAALIAGGTAIGTAITLARGEGWEGVAKHLDIRDTQNFATWEVAGQRIGPGSKLRTLAVLLGKMIKEPENMVGHATNFIRGNFSPVVGTSYDVITGRDYSWAPTRPGKRLGAFANEKPTPWGEGMLGLTRRVIAQNLVPIWAQSTALEGGDITGRAVRAGAEFAGGRAYPVTSLAKPEWEAAIKKYNDIPTDALEIKEKGLESRTQYRKNNPEIDAKLFISGQVNSIQSVDAMSEVLKLIKENKIDPMTIDIVKKWDEQLHNRRLDAGFKETLTDELIQILRIQQKSAAPVTPVAPTETPKPVTPKKRSTPY